MNLNNLKENILGKKLPVYLLNSTPFIIISYWHDFYNDLDEIIQYVPENKNCYFILQLGWHRETDERVKEIKKQIYSSVLKEERFKLLFLCNSKIEEDLFKNNGMAACYCHQNAFLDENKYRIRAINKKYDAIYIARITPFKRHYLSKNIRNLFLIGSHSDKEEDFFNKTLEELNHATWKEKVYARDIFKYINQARVGLCLSKEEGAMFVSAEYLLCGLPVVNTRNLGGRDGIFSDYNSITCEDKPEPVAESVQKLIDKNLDPEKIRQETILQFNFHRKTFIELIQDIHKTENSNIDFTKEWEKVFVHKFGLRCSNIKLLFSKRKYFKKLK